jgi:class 3 adenylate cyclase/tetratricopeptide (TPR) repeat protein
MRSEANSSIGRGPDASIDELLDRAVAALNRGDRATATVLAGRVLAVDHENTDAEDLLAAPADGGEIRRLTILFADLVDSTALSTRLEPERYRTLVGRYREQALQIVDRYEGHLCSTKGDGLLAVFGHPIAHENDVCRAVQAGLEITREVFRISEQAQRRFGVEIAVRVGVHRGLVYLDTIEDDVYGLAANLAARVSGLAPAGSVVVSDAVDPLVRNSFELEPRPAAKVKGVQGLITHYRVIGERAAAGRITRGPLVGRDNEVSQLQRRWAQAEAGTPTTRGVVFRGEPGIGKTRLAAAAIDVARTSEALVLELLGSPLHTDVGLHPVRTLIERRCGIGRLTEQRERLRLLEAQIQNCALDPAATLPLLAPVLGIAAKWGYEPVQAEGTKLYELIATAVHQYLIACVGDGPGLIIVEDLHWFDASTLEVVDALLEASPHRLLIVMTARDDTKLPSASPVELVDLKPLTDAEADELILALDPDLPRADRAAVRGRCDGVPLYIEEVVAGLRLAPADESGRPRVPDKLYDSLFARLHTRRHAVPVVSAAATIGREVDRGLLLSVLDLDEVDVDDVIDELEDGLVLERVGADVWRFRHELLREVAQELSPPSLRRTLHGRVADALVGGSMNGAPDWRLVAFHYDEAQRFDEAATAYERAGVEARRRGLLGEARSCLSQAISHVKRAAAGRERDRREIALRLRRGFLSYAADGTSSEAAAADLERCLLLSGSGRSEQLSATVSALYGYYATRADLRRTAQLLEALRAHIKPEWERSRPFNDAGFAMMAWYRGEFGSALAGLEAVVPGVMGNEELETIWYMPNEPIASVYTHLAAARFVRGDFAGAEAAFEQTACRVQRLGFPQGPYSHAYARFYEVKMRIEAGQLERAAEVATDFAEQAERHGFHSWSLNAATQRAAVDALRSLARGDVEPTELQIHIETVDALLDRWRELGMRVLLNFYDGIIARLLSAAGRNEEARDRLDAALRFAEDTGVHFYDAQLLRLRAQTQHDKDAREADIRAAIELARRQGAVVFELDAAADDVEHRGPVARPTLMEAMAHFPVGSTWPKLARAHSLLR